MMTDTFIATITSNKTMDMKDKPQPLQKKWQALALLLVLFIAQQSFAQKPATWQLEKLPPALETAYALSSLPPQLRPGATVYLLDPNKGYYVARKGNNGF